MHLREEMPQLFYEHFFAEPFRLVVSSELKDTFRLPQDRELTAEDLRVLKNAPFVLLAAKQKVRVVTDQILIAAGINPNICCTTKSMETSKRLVAAGMGVTFLPKSYLNLYSGEEGLVSYSLAPELHGEWKMVVAYRKNERLSRGCREFLRILKACLEE